MSMTSLDPDHMPKEILFEFRTIGNQVRVAAIDAETKLEVIVIVPHNTTQNDMQRLATAKLVRQLSKNAAT